MRVKKEFMLTKIGNNNVAVATGKLSCEFSGVVMLNGCGTFLWSLLQSDVTREQLIAAVLDRYDVSEEQATADIDGFLAKLRENGALEE